MFFGDDGTELLVLEGEARHAVEHGLNLCGLEERRGAFGEEGNSEGGGYGGEQAFAGLIDDEVLSFGNFDAEIAAGLSGGGDDELDLAVGIGAIAGVGDFFGAVEEADGDADTGDWAGGGEFFIDDGDNGGLVRRLVGGPGVRAGASEDCGTNNVDASQASMGAADAQRSTPETRTREGTRKSQCRRGEW